MIDPQVFPPNAGNLTHITGWCQAFKNKGIVPVWLTDGSFMDADLAIANSTR